MSSSNTVTLPRSVVEQALEALTCTGEHDDPGHRCTHCDDYVDRNGPARAALRAALDQPVAGNPVAVPTGWKLVPVEPTEDMLYDIQEFSHILPPRGKRIWAHMLAAAPQPPTVKECLTVEQPQVDQEPYLYYDPNNGDTWTQEAINDGCCLPDGLISLYTK